MSEVFTRIYQNHEWGGISPSGPGADPEATARIADVLPEIVEMIGARSVLDAGCGNGSWMSDLPGYMGIDIVGAVIEEARDLHPNRAYALLDVVWDFLPVSDLVICRDALMHMPMGDGLRALENIRLMGAEWLLATTFKGTTNEDVEMGGFYHINLEAPPFSLGEPLLEVEDKWRHPDKRLGLWAL